MRARRPNRPGAPGRFSRQREAAGGQGLTVVIGAGPHGLAAAAHLRAAGLHTRSFGVPLEFWRSNMPAGMRLRSRKRSSSISDPARELTIDRFEQERGRSPRTPPLASLPLEEFVEYGLWFAQKVVPDLDTRRVRSVSRDDGRFRLTIEDGEVLEAQRVVVAAGISPFPRRPELFAGLPSSSVSHAADHTDLGVFEGRRVLVVGAGQSALESAALLREGGARVEVLVRAPGVRWLREDEDPGPRLALPRPPTDVGGFVNGWIAAAPDLFRRVPRALQPWVTYRCIRPAGSGWLRPRLREVPIVCAARAVRAEHDGDVVRVVMDDGSERVADHVLLATGYEIDITRYQFLAPALVDEIVTVGGYPRLGPGLESSVARLHFLGAPAALSFGPIMRFVVGSWYAAPALALRALGRRQRPLRFSF